MRIRSKKLCLGGIFIHKKHTRLVLDKSAFRSGHARARVSSGVTFLERSKSQQLLTVSQYFEICCETIEILPSVYTEPCMIATCTHWIYLFLRKEYGSIYTGIINLMVGNWLKL